MNELKHLERKIENLVLNEPEYMTYKAAAVYLGRSYMAIRIMVSKGQLKAYKNGGYRYLKTEELKEFMKGAKT